VLWYKEISLHMPLRKVTLGHFGPPKVTVAKAKDEAKAAYRKGKQEATDELNQQILNNRREVHQLLGETLEALDRKIDRCIKDIVDEIPGLVTSIARRVLAEVEIDGAIVRNIVNEVIGDIPSSRQQVEIFLNPNDLALFLSYVEGLERDYPNCKFTGDSHLRSGDCRVESLFGVIDARIDTKLKHIEQQMAS
jgi:flagellar biosynthesis/type III secretory pathway protein FliH